MLKIRCHKTNTCYLLDSGASISVIPFQGKVKPIPFKALRAANGSIIETFGSKILEVDLGFGQNMQHEFILAKVSQPILGADFLIKYGIIIDMKRKRISLDDNSYFVEGQITSTNIYAIEALHCEKARELLDKYPGLTDYSTRRVAIDPAYEHEIITEGNAPHFKSRKLNPKMRKLTKDHFDKLLREGVVERSVSEYASPLHIVPKKGGVDNYRFVGDYRALNDVTTKSRYPLPLIQDCVTELNGKTIFSSVDLRDAFHLLPIKKNSIEKTGLITPVGLFQYRYMCFGLCNASQSWQRFIDMVLRDLKRTDNNGMEREVTVFAYIDDLLVSSESPEEHAKDLEALFERLDKFGLKLNSQKCQFFKEQLTFLGHMITNQGIKPIPDKVQAILDIKRPETLGGLKKFLGTVNFYHKYIQNAAHIMAPLHRVLKGYKKKLRFKKIDWDVNKEANEAIKNTKNALANVTLLAYPDKEGHIGLFTDASISSIGCSLQQRQQIDGVYQWRPLGFYSKDFSPKERQGSTFTRELTAVYRAVKYFKHLIEGYEFTVYTDHKSLIHAFQRTLDRDVPKESRMLSYISQFNINLIHLPGSSDEIQVADFLSRPYEQCNSVELLELIPRSELISEQQKSEELKQVLQSESGLKLEKIQEVYCNIINNYIRPFVPESLRTKIFKNIHELSHNGSARTLKQIQQRFVWPNMKKDIPKWCQSCIECQKNKIVRHNKGSIGPFNLETEKFSHINMDIVGPLYPSHGYRYLLTIVDNFSGYPEAIPIKNTLTETILEAFTSRWIAHFGVPSYITTDRGPQFTSVQFKEVMNKLGVKHHLTMAYMPRSNSIVERMHKTLKVSLRSGPASDWIKRLSFTLLSLRTSYSEGIKCAPSDIVYGTNLRLPGDMFESRKTEFCSPDSYAEKLRVAMNAVEARRSNFKVIKGYQEPALKSCDFVFVRNLHKKHGLESQYLGPFKVIKRQEKFFTIQMNRKIDHVPIDRLKAAYLNPINDEPDTQKYPSIIEERSFVAPTVAPKVTTFHELIDKSCNEASSSSENNLQVMPLQPSNVNTRDQSSTDLQNSPLNQHSSKNMADQTTRSILKSPNVNNVKKQVTLKLDPENIKRSYTTSSGRVTKIPFSYK